MDYSQVSFPWFHVQDAIRSPLQETMTNLKANITELRRSQAQFMEEVNKPSQDESNFEIEVDELAITMANLAKSRAEFFKEETRINVQIQPITLESLEKEMTRTTISCTQSTIKKEQPRQEK